MQTYPDKRMDKYIDSVLAIVAAAQEPDGYLYTARTMNPDHQDMRWMGKHRWDREEAGSHELYNLGHLIEGAVAHYQATGKRNFWILPSSSPTVPTVNWVMVRVSVSLRRDIR